MNAARTILARAMLAGSPGTRRIRLALAKVLPGSYMAHEVTWFGGIR